MSTLGVRSPTESIGEREREREGNLTPQTFLWYPRNLEQRTARRAGSQSPLLPALLLDPRTPRESAMAVLTPDVRALQTSLLLVCCTWLFPSLSELQPHPFPPRRIIWLTVSQWGRHGPMLWPTRVVSLSPVKASLLRGLFSLY